MQAPAAAFAAEPPRARGEMQCHASLGSAKGALVDRNNLRTLSVGMGGILRVATRFGFWMGLRGFV